MRLELTGHILAAQTRKHEETAARRQHDAREGHDGSPKDADAIQYGHATTFAIQPHCGLSLGDVMPSRNLGKKIVGGSSFARLTNEAARYLRNPNQLKELVRRATRKADSARGAGPLKEVWNGLQDFLRMILAFVTGKYREVSWQTLVLVVAAVLYFVMPIDVMPDFLVGVGYVDDAAVIAWVMSAISDELLKFRVWQASRAESGGSAAGT